MVVVLRREFAARLLKAEALERTVNDTYAAAVAAEAS